MSKHGWIVSVPWERDVAVAFTRARLAGALPASLPETVEVVCATECGPSDAIDCVTPVMELELLAIFGTIRPTRAQISAHAVELMQLRPADTFCCLAAHDDRGLPLDYVFCGPQVESAVALRQSA